MRTFLVLTACIAVASGSQETGKKPRGSRGVTYTGALQYNQAHAQLHAYGAPHAQAPLGVKYIQAQAPVSYSYGTGGGNLGLVSPVAPIAPVGLGYPEQISKSVYVFSAPPDPFDNIQPQVIKSFPQQKRKHYQVVFINAPNPPLPVQHTVELPTPPELKTQVYVLVKKPQKAPPLKVIPAKVPVHKPEVYFIRYQNQKGHGIPTGPSGPSVSDGGYGGPSGGGLLETSGPSGDYGPPADLTQYGAPVDSGPSHYGPPADSGPSHYEAPSHNEAPVDSGPSHYGAPADSGPSHYGVPIDTSAGHVQYEAPTHSSYETGHNSIEGPSISGGGYLAPAGDYGAPPSSGYGAPPSVEYGASPASEYGSPSSEYGAPSSEGGYGGGGAESYATASVEYGSRGGRPGSNRRDMYSDYSRLNALYSYAPRYAKRRMDNNGKWKPILRNSGGI